MGGMILGARRPVAADYSFIAAVPIMVAATGFDLLKSWSLFSTDDLLILGIGFVGAFISACLLYTSLACNVARSGKRAGHKLVEHMPVKPGDIDIDRYGPGLGHACHGHEAGHEEVDVGQSVDGDAAHGAGEGREIEQGGDKPGGELFRHAPAQDEHFPEKDRPGARERMYFRPVSYTHLDVYKRQSPSTA